jgi:uncharacterized protein YjbI with pentapeptide repeats
VIRAALNVLRSRNAANDGSAVINFTNTNLTDANLSGINLSGATLISTDFTAANLSAADLSGAELSYAYFGDASLTGTNLANTVLTGASFPKLRCAMDQSPFILPKDSIALNEGKDADTVTSEMAAW